jgi:hypothetical protein
MKKNKLFICEKPSTAKYHSFLLEEGDLVIIACGTASYKFDYQEISFNEAPYTNEIPKYKVHDDGIMTPLTIDSWNSKGRFENEILKKIISLNQNKEGINKITSDFLDDFEEIIFSSEANLTGVRGFCFKFEKFFNMGKNWKKKIAEKGIKITSIIHSSLDNKALLKAYKNRTLITNNKIFKILEDSFIKKDFFEYNYNLNSLLFFKEALDLPDHLISEYDFILTKNYILTLFLVRDKEILFSDYLHEVMEKNNIGNLISHHIIIENLLKLGLIKEDKSNPLKSKSASLYYQYKITEIGNDFTKKLHKKINDPHLGSRLKNDNLRSYYHYDGKTQLSIEEFKIKYEKYLYEVFSRQKRFIRNINRN